MHSSNSENSAEECSEVEIRGREEESSLSDVGSSTDESTKLTEEQEEHYQAIIECIALNLVAFEASRKNHKDNEHRNSNNSDVESDDKDTQVEKVYDTQKEEKCRGRAGSQRQN